MIELLGYIGVGLGAADSPADLPGQFLPDPSLPGPSLVASAPARSSALPVVSTQAADLQPAPPAAPPAPTVTPDSNPTNSQPDPAGRVPEKDRQNPTIQSTFGGPSDQGFSANFGSAFVDPTALQGANRSHATNAQPSTDGIFSITAYGEQKIGMNQRWALELTGDPGLFALDAAYSIKPASLPGFFSVNVSNTRSPNPVFDEGRRKVNLPHDQKPWLHRLGGGVEYFQPMSPNLGTALALNYQRVSVRNRMVTSQLSPRDQLGNLLTVSPQGQDDLLTLNLLSFYSSVDNPDYATQGSKLRLGVDQAIPVGQSQIAYTRFSASATQFIPLNLFGFGAGARTLVLNLQGGTVLGRVPAYEAFTLGGGDTVRGYTTGDVGSGSRFVLATIEYRFPLFQFAIGQHQFETRGVLFADYGSLLDSERNVRGNPSGARLKPGEGVSYGGGFHIMTPVGVVRVELGWNDRGENQVIFDIGDHF